jgi:hypothetical protein
MIRAPPNLLMINICYPIFENKKNNNIECNVNSQKGNMRVYRIDNTNASIIQKLKEEVKYYIETRNIIKSKVCPNFVLSYGMIIGNYTIDWNNIANMKNEIPISSDNSICLVNLTESISQNIIVWASPVINTNDRNDVVITIMNNSGSHNLNKWKNVLFQLLIGIYILIKKDIFFNNFSLENNVYIKSINSSIYKYWKYIINDVEYFIPNHGNLVMIDSNFKHSKIGLKNLDSTFTFGSLFDKIKLTGDRNNLINNIKTELISIDTIINTMKAGATDLSTLTPANINTLIHLITDKIIYIIVSNFYEYISDDIGKMVNNQDLDISYNKMNHYDAYKPGDLVVYNKYDINIISVYKNKDNSTNRETIITNLLDINRYGIDQNNIGDNNITPELITKIINRPNSKDIIDIYKVN